MAKQHCVLVVEDDIDGAEVIDWMLKSQNIQTVIVATGEAAVEQVRASAAAFSAIITDLVLPQMDGFEVLTFIKGQPNTALPTIAVTAFHAPELREKALRLGFDAYLPKPLDKDVLMKVLRQFLN